MPKRFTKDFLNEICVKYNITLLREYEESELGCKKFIEFKCVKCNENTSKAFTFIIKYNPICHKCSNLEKGNKARNTTLIKYGVKNISQLDEIKNKKKETTLKNYGVEHNSQCQSIKYKKIVTCLKNNNVEHPQQSTDIKNKSKQTCLLNHGVEHPSQSKEIKNKQTETIFKKYGVEHYSQTKEFNKKFKQTCLLNHGVEYPLQSEEIKNKSKQTCLLNHGVEYPSQSEEIKQKQKETIFRKHGVEYYSQTKEFHEKCKQTCLNKYGVEHPSQCKEIMDKNSKAAYKLKIFKFPSNNEIKCQGYEPFALKELIEHYNENDIITGCKNVPTIWYNDIKQKKHRHYVDIYIPSENKCIEVKSTWTLKKKKDIVFEKQLAAKELGFNYEIWVYDCKGNKVEIFL